MNYSTARSISTTHRTANDESIEVLALMSIGVILRVSIEMRACLIIVYAMFATGQQGRWADLVDHAKC